MCFTTHHISIIVILTLTILVIGAEAKPCFTEPITNDDFEISCTKSRFLKVEITCKTAEPWSNLPNDKLNLVSVKATVFFNCSFGEGLKLIDVTKTLGLGNIDILKFENSRSMLHRENLKGFTVTTLELVNSIADKVPNDLLYDIGFEELFIDGGNLTSIPKDFFKNATTLRNLEIVNNKLYKLKRDDFTALKKLKDFLVFGNEIQEIELGTFDKLVNLRVLEISKNKLKTLPSDIFKNLVKLERINLSENDFAELPPDLLRIENSRLQRVRLNHNRGGLASLPNGFLRNLSSLDYAELTSNNFSSIPADLFYGSNSLKSLNISNNSLVELPEKIFESTSSLRELWLSENKLEKLPDGIFEELSLEILYLDDNRLTNLSAGILTGLTSLKVLQASYNNLKHIDYNACKHLDRVEYVDLSHNQLTFANPEILSFSVFINCVQIIDMNISHNNVSEIFEDFEFNGNLKHLNMENNNITNLTASDFKVFHTNAEVNLRNNKITTIDLSDLEKLVKDYRELNYESDKNVLIYLEGNPLNCDCNLLHFIRYFEHKLNNDVYAYVKFSANNLSCASPPQLKNQNISKIRSEDLNCLIHSNETGDACSKICSCREYPGKEVLAVDCSYRNLTTVPEYIKNERNWSIELNLSGNKFRKTPSLNYSYLLNVTVLDLSNNNISTVSIDVFSPSLRDLKLHNNSISRLDYKVVEYLSEGTLLHTFTLHHNKWICDCEARNFLSAVHQKLTILDLHKEMCHGTNKPLSTMTSIELCEGEIVIMVVASLLVALMGVVSGISAALYYRYQKEIKVWLYSKQWCLWFVTEDELDKDKQYDAFISYSHKDEDFVNKEIVSKLEEGPRPYKLCLHYRDWLAGEWIPTQIARSVEESKRTVVILSPNFIESVWGRMEFRTAHSQALSEGRARVIVILYGDIGNTDDLDPELKAYLSMNTYVKWGDPWFWDKLKYALPHRYESSRRKTRKARIIENHLAQLPTINRDDNDKTEVISMPKIINSSNDSVKLLDSGVEDDRITATC